MTKAFQCQRAAGAREALVRRVGGRAPPRPRRSRWPHGVRRIRAGPEKPRTVKNGTPIDAAGGVPDHGAVFANPGVALVREKILEGVWGENYFGDVKIVDVNIRRLRMKIEDEPSAPKHILTVWGLRLPLERIALVLYFLWAEGAAV